MEPANNRQRYFPACRKITEREVHAKAHVCNAALTADQSIKITGNQKKGENPYFPTNIRELTRIIESFKDYVVGTALNMPCHAAKDPKEPSAKRS